MMRVDRQNRMRTEQEIVDLLKKVMSFSQADQTEVLYFGKQSALTRFANNYIHQNVAEDDTSISIRAVRGKRTGIIHTNRLDDTSLQEAVASALAIAQVQPENPDFVSLPAPAELPNVLGFSETTATYTPEKRAAGVNVLVRLAKECNLASAGAFETTLSQLAVTNTLGIQAFQERTDAEFHAVVMADNGGSGWTQRVAMDVDNFDFEAMAHEAVGKAEHSRNPIELPVGEYVTVLDTYAAGEMLENLSFMGMDALSMEEERSFLTGRMGQQIVNPMVTIYDDAYSSEGLPTAFDYEGVPKQRVEIICQGVANAVVYDSFTANKEGKPNTGHALPAPNTFGPFPENLMMAAGDASIEELIHGIERGVYVTRFHYTNTVHPIKTLFTGMTRDGTFLIDHGELTQPVKSFRFTQSILEALSSVQQISRERVKTHNYVTVVAPALRVGTFSFTGVTK